jgi:membrane protease YdiL (CAAX protease family)
MSITISRKSENYFTLVGIFSILFLLFLLSLLGTSPLLNLFGLSKINATLLFISRILYWLSLVLLWLYSIKFEKQNLLIWDEQKYKLSTFLISIIVIFAVLIIGLILISLVYRLTGISKTSIKLLEMVAVFRANKLLLVFTALTAGVVEELIFRGYLQPRLEIILKKLALAIVISSILFALLHYRYGTVINIIGPFFIGLIFSYYYWKYRNITILIICHFLWDLMSLFLLVNTGQ